MTPPSRNGDAVLSDRMELRVTALQEAHWLEASRADKTGYTLDLGHLLHDANQIYAWLTAPVRLTLAFGPITDQASGAVVSPDHEGATPMANLELGDSQQVTATVVPDDADNQPTTDTLTWTASAPTAVTLQPSADTLSCVILGAVPTPNVIITATDPNGLTVTGELDVVAGPATSLSLSFGAVTAQPAPAASATPAGAPTETAAPATPAA